MNPATSRTTREPTPNDQQQLWIHDDGRVLCREHLGHYATAELDRRPSARQLETPLGTWQRLSFADRAWFAEHHGAPICCETCNARVRSRLQLRRIK